MKREAFLLSAAGAALAGTAGASGAPIAVATGRMVGRSRFDDDRQLLGSLLLTPYEFVPKPFAACHGQLLKVNSNVALFSLLGTKFGGDGQNDFGLPDMRGREPIAGLSYVIATRGFYPSRKGLETYAFDAPPLYGQLLLVPYVPSHLPPRGWEKCDGQILNINQHVVLYSLIGAKFGGNGQTTFALPDLRGHEPGKHLTYLIATSGIYPSER